jgi:hypothetical protein
LEDKARLAQMADIARLYSELGFDSVYAPRDELGPDEQYITGYGIMNVGRHAADAGRPAVGLGSEGHEQLAIEIAMGIPALVRLGLRGVSVALARRAVSESTEAAAIRTLTAEGSTLARAETVATRQLVGNTNTLRQVGRGDVIRNAEALTESQIAQLRTMAGQVGLGPEDLQFVRTPSAYSDTFDKVLIGPNVFPSAAGMGNRSVLARLTPRAVLAHEQAHLLTTRAGKALEGGTLLDEVQASLVARQLRGLNKVERYQLLRDAVERAKGEGQNLRDLLDQLPYLTK